MTEVDQHGEGDNAGEDVVQGDKTVVNNPEPAEPETPAEPEPEPEPDQDDSSE